jgi:hypothetical protein
MLRSIRNSISQRQASPETRLDYPLLLQADTSAKADDVDWSSGEVPHFAKPNADELKAGICCTQFAMDTSTDLTRSSSSSIPMLPVRDLVQTSCVDGLKEADTVARLTDPVFLEQFLENDRKA